MNVFNAEIYNRWGETVFSWDERKKHGIEAHDGQMLPESLFLCYGS